MAKVLTSLPRDNSLGLERFGHKIDPLPLEIFSQPSVITRPANPEMLIAIRHPFMWYAFLRLSEQEQMKALDGDASATSNLARDMVDRFADRVRSRHPNRDLEKKPTIYALHKIGSACFKGKFKGSQRWSKKDWVSWGKHSHVPDYQVGALFTEAASEGLIKIEPDGVHWAWRHRFVLEYLYSSAPVET